MPDAKDNAKATGDFHPPEVEDEGGSPQGAPQATGAHGSPPDSDLSRDLENEGRAGKAVNQAGYLKDKDGGVGKDKP
jgi:hypothetical protein